MAAIAGGTGVPETDVRWKSDLKTVESRYGEDVLQLVIASGY